MNLAYIVNAIRLYGFKGCRDAVQNVLKRKRFERALQQTETGLQPMPGITIVSAVDAPISLSKVMRDLAIRLKRCGIPCQVYNVPGTAKPIPESEYAWLLTPQDEFHLDKYATVLGMRTAPPVHNAACRSSCAIFWEFDEGLTAGQPETLRIDDFVVFSDYNRDVLAHSLPPATRIRKLLYPFQFEHRPLAPAAETRAKYGLGGKDDFLLFFNFDYASSYYRKNPEGILRAFAKAFGNETRPRLVFKTMRAKAKREMSDRLHVLAARLGLADRLVCIDDFIPQEDLVNLVNACDVYVSLHRGEGFGIGIAEAMALGKPVVVTDYSATTEFCTAENAMLVPFEKVPVKPDQIDVFVYKDVHTWPEPDVDAAAAALRKLYDDPAFRKELGEKARRSIAGQFSDANFKASVEAFLRET